MVKKLVVVTGATGKQGGSLVNALVAHGGYEIRALSRNVDSAASKALAGKSVSVVHGHLADKESLVKAFAGAYAVFGVSTPEAFGAQSEILQGHNLVDACKENDVPLLIWSSLPSIKGTSNGKHAVAAFDDKVEVEKYIASAGQPAIVFRTGGFTENMLNHGSLKRDEQDPSKYHLYGPFVESNVPQPSTYVEKDVGPVVLAAIEKWEGPTWKAELTKGPIPLVSYQLAGKEAAEILTKITGKSVDYITIQPDSMHPMLKTMSMWQQESLWGYGNQIPVDILLKLGVKFHTLEDYAREKVLPWMNAQG